MVTGTHIHGYLRYIQKLNTEDAGLLGCDVLLGEWFPMFEGNVVSSTSESRNKRRMFLYSELLYS
jgi:hypothetical protein